MEACAATCWGVLGADLNTWGAPFLEEALDVLYQRFTDTPEQEEPTYTLAGVIRRRLDHLLFRLPGHKRAEAWRVDDRYGSDHFPVLGVVRIAGLSASGAPAEPFVTGSAAGAP